jgi:hypothetical protein
VAGSQEPASDLIQTPSKPAYAPLPPRRELPVLCYFCSEFSVSLHFCDYHVQPLHSLCSSVTTSSLRIQKRPIISLSALISKTCHKSVQARMLDTMLSLRKAGVFVPRPSVILCKTKEKVDLVLMNKDKEVTVSCSRTLLASGSEHFQAMLYGKFVEAAQDVVSVHDDDIDSMIVMLRHLHDQPCNLHAMPHVLDELYNLAVVYDKYIVAEAFRKAMAALVEERLDSLRLLSGGPPIPYDSDPNCFEIVDGKSVPNAPYSFDRDPGKGRFSFNMLEDCSGSEALLCYHKELLQICLTFKLDKQFRVLIRFIVFNLYRGSQEWTVGVKFLGRIPEPVEGKKSAVSLRL